MAASQTEIRDALAARLLERLAPGVQIRARPMSNPTPPSIYIRGGAIEYDQTFGRGHDEHILTVIVFVANTTDEGAQLRLDEFMAPEGPFSIKYALDARGLDRTLGGLVHGYRAESCSGPITYTFDAMTTGATRLSVLGAEWLVRVLN
jgi:hypothetical protein